MHFPGVPYQVMLLVGRILAQAALVIFIYIGVNRFDVLAKATPNTCAVITQQALKVHVLLVNCFDMGDQGTSVVAFVLAQIANVFSTVAVDSLDVIVKASLVTGRVLAMVTL
jgi:hypothetical protein